MALYLEPFVGSVESNEFCLPIRCIPAKGQTIAKLEISFVGRSVFENTLFFPIKLATSTRKIRGLDGRSHNGRRCALLSN